MKKILFITSRNVINTCGELRLIKNRADTLYEQFQISTDFLVFTHKSSKNPEQICGSEKMEVFRFSPKNPFSILRAYRQMKKQIRSCLTEAGYDYVIISGNLVLPLIKTVKEISSVRCFADVHGACEELIEFQGSSLLKRTFRRLLYRYFKHTEKRYFRYFDDILAVSQCLAQYVCEEYGVHKDSHIVPCAVRRFEMDTQSILCQRQKARERYGISDDEILFIYSGGVSPWQCIQQTVDVFREIKKLDSNNRCKLLLLSGNKAYMEKFRSDDILIDSLSPDVLAKTLPAGDFAFMLRQDYITNNVAYPNKFLEYVASGMKVISTPFIADVAKQIQEYKLGYLLNGVAFEKGLAQYCLYEAEPFGQDMAARQALINDTCFENRLEFFGDGKE